METSSNSKLKFQPEVSDGWFLVEYDNTETGASSIAEWICGYSRAKITFDPSKVTVSDGASINFFSVIYGGKETFASDNIATTDIIEETSAVIIVKVSDSNGNITFQEYNVNTLEYKKPTITDVSVYRSDSLKAADDAGHYLTVKGTPGYTSLNGKNTVTFTASYKQIGESAFGDDIALQSNELTIINEVEVSAEKSYVVRLKTTDALGNSSSYEQIISTREVAFHLKPGGKGAAFGKYAERDNLLDVKWPVNFENEAKVKGELYAMLGVIAGEISFKIISGGNLSNTPDGWDDFPYGRAIVMGKETDSDRYYFLVQGNGNLYTGCAMNGAEAIKWYKKG